MARYHLGKDGPMKCSAQIQCPLQKKAIENGEDPNQIFHYENKAAAMKAYQEKMDNSHSETIHETLKKPVKNVVTRTSNGRLEDDIVVQDISDMISEKYLDGRIFTGTKISGHIDPDKLDDESYKLFGFERHTAEELIAIRDGDTRGSRRKNYKMEYLSSDVSSEVSEDLSFEQRMAIWTYTSTGAKSINRYLSTYKTNESAKITNANRARIRELDAAIEKSPSFQRIVYRGNQWEFNHLRPKSVKNFDTVVDWVRTERKLGNVVQYDSYTSTSYSRYETKAFAGTTVGPKKSKSHTVMYEILAADGVPVEAITSCRGEDEVILPREQRFVVVGNYETSTINNRVLDNGEETLHIIQMVAVDKDNNILDGTNYQGPEPLSN